MNPDDNMAGIGDFFSSFLTSSGSILTGSTSSSTGTPIPSLPAPAPAKTNWADWLGSALGTWGNLQVNYWNTQGLINAAHADANAKTSGTVASQGASGAATLAAAMPAILGAAGIIGVAMVVSGMESRGGRK